MKIVTARAVLVLLCLSMLAGCGGASSESGDAQAATAGGESSTTAFPATYAPGQGERAFGVYLVRAASGDAPVIESALTQLRARGVADGGAGQLSCDQGAADVLGGSSDDVVVSVSFRTREQADRFVAAWGEPVLGVAEFVAYCRD